MRFLHQVWAAAFLGAVVTPLSQAQGLSIPGLESGPDQQNRAAKLVEMSGAIRNEHRDFIIRGQPYPLYTGAVSRPGSLAASIAMKETEQLKQFQDPNVPIYMHTATITPFTTIQDYLGYYDKIIEYIPRPMTTDMSDDTFGETRLTIYGYNMRVVEPQEFHRILLNVPRQAARMACGNTAATSIQHAVAAGDVFVLDFSGTSKWNDVERPFKYCPNTIGFFCFNRQQHKLLPLAIHFPDTQLTYTPLDTTEEWMLAKMALNVVEINFQQMEHYAETHAVSAPSRVELLRNMAPEHPISALLQHHFRADLALEGLSAVMLFNDSTTVDLTFGWGATGMMRFMNSSLSNPIALKYELYTDAKRRGIDRLPIHKRFKYQKMHHTALKQFVTEYVRAYYRTDRDVVTDRELQNWLEACTLVPHLRDFPRRITNRNALVDLLTHLVFTVTGKHHAMNGMPTWHAMSIPYSSAALWKPMPTKKLAPGETLNLAEFVIPGKLVPAFIGGTALFHRPVPAAESLQNTYATAPFSNEKVLTKAIARYEAELREIEARIIKQEEDETWPYMVLRPSLMPYSSWI